MPSMAVPCLNFRTFLWLLLLVFSMGYVHAQEKPIIGSLVPNTSFMVYQNGVVEQKEFSNYKGKLLIIDFWATWCSSCIKKLPELQALQAQFKDEIQILMVSTESESKINAFLDRRKSVKQPNITLPMVMADEKLTALFPHQLLPHEVWIATDGKLYAITDAEEVNAVNIQKALAKQSLTAQSKVDIDASRPLFTVPELPINGLQNYSLLLKGYYPGLPSGTRYRKADGITYGIGISNFKLADLFYAVACRLNPQLLKKQMVMPVDDANLAEHFSMEFAVPINLAKDLPLQMLTALNQYSGYTGVLKAEKRPCLILKKSGDTDLLLAKATKYQNHLEGEHLQLAKAKMISFINRLNELEGQDLVYLDESGITQAISIEVDLSTDPNVLNKQLAPYGLQLELAERVIDLCYVNKNTIN